MLQGEIRKVAASEGLGESRELHICGTTLDPNWLNCPECEGPSQTSVKDLTVLLKAAHVGWNELCNKPDLHSYLAEVALRYRSLPTWVSTKDKQKLPPLTELVLISKGAKWTGRRVFTAERQPFSSKCFDEAVSGADGTWYWHSYRGNHHDPFTVTYWMPLPEPAR